MIKQKRDKIGIKTKQILALATFLLVIALVVAPASYLLFTSANDFLFTNSTENSSLGARITAAVLSMDFNSAGENYLNLPYQNGSLYEQGTYIKDGSVYNNFGTSSGLTSQYWWNGNTNGASVINGSLQFDGVNDYVNTTGANLLNGTNEVTFSAWINKRSDIDFQGIVFSRPSTPTNTIPLGLGAGYSGKVRWTISNYTTSEYIETSAIPLNSWYHILGTWKSGEKLQIYVNGSWVANSTNIISGTLLQNAIIKIGTDDVLSNRVFNGSIDDVIIWGRALNSTEISTLYSEGIAGRTISNDTILNGGNYIYPDNSSLVNYWDFADETNTTFIDVTGNINGTYQNGAYSNITNGKFGNGGYFDGANDIIEINSTDLLNNKGNTSISVWVKERKYGAYNTILGARNGGSSYFLLYEIGGRYEFDSVGVGGFSGPNSVKNNQWQMITLVFTNHSVYPNIKMYLDGKLVSSQNPNGGAYLRQSSKLYVGMDPGMGRYWNGSIDEIRIYNKTLSAQEISDMYDQQRLHLPLDELSGTSANETASGVAAGTLTNYPTTALTAPVWNATGGVNGSGAYQFDGVDDVINSSAPWDSTTAPNDMTFTAWIKYPELDANNLIYGKMPSAEVKGDFVLSTSSSGTGKIILYRAFTGGNVDLYLLDTPGVVVPNEWTMVTVTCIGADDGNCTFYINGNSKTITTTLSTNQVYGLNNWVIGGGSINPFNGSIDNVQIFNRALSASEVLALYNGTNANKTIKYSAKQGDFTSGVYYNSTQQYWSANLATGDTFNKSGIVNPDNSINISYPNLVSYWPLDGSFADAKGTNNATAVAGANGGLNNYTGFSGGATRFDGVDDWVNTTITSSLGTDYTVSTWLKVDQTGAYQGAWSGDNTWGYAPRLASDVGTNYFSCVCSSVAARFSAVRLNIWELYTCVYNSTGVWGYRNGVLVTNVSGTPNNLRGFVMGRYYSTSNGNTLNGSLSDFVVYNKTLSASEIFQLYKSGLSQHANTNVTIQTRTANTYNITDPSLVALLTFNNVLGENSTYFKDELGINNASCSGTSCPIISNQGVVGNTYTFDGSNDYMLDSNQVDLNGSNYGTWSAWVKPATTAGGVIFENRQIYLFWSPYVANRFGGDVYRGSGWVNGDAGPVTPAIYPAGVWHFVVVTWDGVAGRHRIYVNGALANETMTTAGAISKSLTTNLTIGTYYTKASYFFNGSIDEVRIYNRSLSASEVLDLYNLGTSHILWNNNGNWSNESVVVSDTPKITSAPFKFFQFHANLYSNDSNIAPYVISANITTPDLIAPNVTSQAPSNNTFTNQLNQNFTANLTDDVAGIKNATVVIYNQSGLFNQTTFNFANSKYALSFDGTSGYLDCGNSAKLTPANITVAAWVKLGTVNNDAYFVSYGNTAGNGYHLGTLGGKFVFMFAGHVSLSSITVPPTGRWVFLAATFNGSVENIYINGTLENNQTETAYGAPTGNFVIGRKGATAGGYENATIDEVMVFNRSLNASEIAQLYNNYSGLYTNPNQAPFNTGLAAAWHFDEGAGITAYDILGVSNGTLNAGVTWAVGKVTYPTNYADQGILQTTVGIVITMVEGVYNWLWSIFDWNNNLYNSNNQTLSIDTTSANATLNTPVNNFILNLSNSDNVSFAPLASGSYVDSSNSIFTNATDIANLGIRNNAPVLSIDFNSPAENFPTTYNSSLGTTQGTYIKDNSIYNNYGTTNGYLNDSAWRNIGSLINNSLQFDGVDDYVSLTNVPINGDINYTLSLWAKQTVITNPEEHLFSLGSTTGYPQLYKNAGTGGLVMLAGGTSGIVANVFNNNTWIQVAYTRVANYSGTESNITIYVNGSAKTSFRYNGTIVNPGFTAKIGSFVSAGYSWNGSIDDVILWNRALNSTEISTIYSEGLAGRTINLTDDRVFPADSRVAYWKLDNNITLGDNSTYFTDTWGTFNGSCSGITCPNVTDGLTSNAMRFDGSNDYINLGNVSSNSKLALQNNTNWTISLWFKTITGYNGYLFQEGAFQTDGFYIYTGTTGTIQVRNNNATASSNTASSPFLINNTWYNLVVTQINGRQTIYIDGINNTASQNTFVYNNQANTRNILLGIYDDKSTGAFNGSIDEVQVWNRSLTADEIKRLYYSEVTHFKLDELFGSQTNAVWGSTGTLTNYPTTATTAPVWNATGGVNGSGAYVFDGVDDYITTNLINDLDVNKDYTISLFVNVLDNDDGGILFNYLNANSRTTIKYINAGTLITVGGYDGSSYYAKSGTITKGVWNYITLVHYSNKTNMLYINNIPQAGTTPPTTGSGTKFYLGSNSEINPTSNNLLNGSIDNVQIFNRALTAQEVLELYNGTSANTTIKYSTSQGDFTSGVFYNSTSTYWNVSLATADTTSRSGIVNPDNSINISNPNLVSYWALDGNYLDAKGINNGTCTSCPNNASGLSSGAMRFDGASKYLNYSNTNLSSNFSFSTWVYTNNIAIEQGIFSKFNNGNQGAYLEFYNSKLYFNTDGNLGIGGTSALSSNQWYNIIATYNGSYKNLYLNGNLYANGSGTITSITNRDFLIGAYNYGAPSLFLNGLLDEVLIYNTSLSASQVSQLYKSGLSQHSTTNVTIQTRTANSYNVTDPSLVGFWAMNNESSIGENSTYFVDSTGRNNGTCSGTGCPTLNSSGIVGNAMRFDGVNDYVNVSNYIPTNNLPLTYSAWVYSLNPSGTGAIVGDQNAAGGTSETGQMLRVIANTFQFVGSHSNGSRMTLSSSTINANQWYHVVGTYDASTNISSIYVNGVLNNNASQLGGRFSGLPRTKIGAYYNGATWFFNGTIDEVRIYNRSLSASEVLDLYNLGATHITDWTNWTNQTIIQDGVSKLSQTSGKFMQIKTTLNSNTTDVSPSILSYSVSGSTLNPYGSVKNLTVNITDSLSGIANATLVVLNASNTSQQIVSSTLVLTNPLTATVGIIVSLVDGIYNWFYQIFDLAGNLRTTSTNTIIVDNVAPNATLNTPANNTFINVLSQDFFNWSAILTPFAYVASETTNIGVRNNAPVLAMDFNAPAENLPNFYNNSANIQGQYIKDGSVYNNFGTTSGYLNDSDWRNIGSKINNSLMFDGIDDYVSLSSAVSTPINITLSFWMNPLDNSSNGGSLLSHYSNGVNGSWQVWWNTYTGGLCRNKIRFEINAPGAQNCTNMTLGLNNWSHVVITVQNDYVNMYVNNQLGFSGIMGNLSNSSIVPLFIGKYTTGTSYFNGSVDDAIMWNRALNSSEISTIYNNGLSGLTTNNSTVGNQVAHFRLDELSGTTANNDMNASASGTLTNYPSATTPKYNATGGPDGSGAYQFDGVDDYISGPVLSAINRTITMAGWFKAASFKSYSTYTGTKLFGLEYNNFQQGLGLKYFNTTNARLGGGAMAGDFSSQCNQITSPTLLNLDTWYFGAVSIDLNNNNLSLYLNGNLVNSSNLGSCTSIAATSAFLINSGNADTGWRTNGTIDNVQIFNRALSVQEVLALYNGTNANKTIKYSNAGASYSQVSYNSNLTFWNVTLDHSANLTGSIVDANGINLSNPNLVSYLSLDQNFNDPRSIANVSCSNTCPNNATGISSSAMEFDGTNNTILNLKNNSLLQLQKSDFAISLWMKQKGGSEGRIYAPLISKIYNNVYSWLLTPAANTATPTLSFYLYSSESSTTGFQTTQTFPINNWYHIVASSQRINVTSINMSLWANGRFVQNAVLAYNSTSTGNGDVQLGRWASDDSRGHFNGTIDEVILYNVSLTASQITQIYKSGISQHANTNVTIQTRTASTYNVSDPSLVGFWALNNDSSIGENSTYFVDSTGRNNGTCSGTGCPTLNSSGIVGNAMSFDGVDDGVNSTNNITTTSQTTLSIWINPSSITGIKAILNLGGGSACFISRFTTGKLLCIFDGSSSNNGATNESSTTLQTGNWYHIVGTNNGTTTKIYINSILENTYAESSLINTGKMIIGNNFGTQYFNGLIDEVRIYNRSLSAAEVLDLYNLGATHIQNWSSWSQEQIASSGQGIVAQSGQGKFMQYKINMYSNTSDVSPYVLNQTVITQSNAILPLVVYKNLTVNLSDAVGIKNATLTVVNASNTSQIITQNTVSFVQGTFQSTIGIVVSLVEGVYNWFYQVYDWALMQFTTDNRTIGVDNTNPQISLVYPANTTYNIAPSNITYIISDLNPAYCWYSFNNGVTNYSTNCVNASNSISVVFANVTQGNNAWSVWTNDSAGNTNYSSVNFYVDSLAPNLVNFNPNTESAGSYLNRNNIFVNITTTDNLNLASLTFYLANITSLVSSITQTASGVSFTNITNFTNLADNLYFINATATDALGNTNSSIVRNITIDTTLPIGTFILPTPANNSGSNTQITIALNVSELNLKNATFSWNNTNYYFTLANFSGTSGVYYISTTNKTSLFAGQTYNYYFTICDLANNCNPTEIRTVKGNTAPVVTIVSPTTQTGNYSQNEIIANITAIDGEANMNATYVNLYYQNNWQNLSAILFNQTFFNFNSSLMTLYLNYSNLTEGIYYLNATAIDIIGEISNTSTKIIVIDLSLPNATSLIPNNTYTNYSNVNFTANFSDNLGIANATLNIYNSTNNLISSNPVAGFIQGTVSTTIGVVVNLVDGIYNWFYNLFDWAGNQAFSENRTITTDTVSPNMINIVYTPDNNDTIDPNTFMQFNVTIRDATSGANSAVLEIFNSTDWNNYSMNLVSGNKINGVWNANFTTAPVQTNYTFKIWANDTSNNAFESANSTFYSFWDCTWSATTNRIGFENSFGSIAGFNANQEMGNITIQNTGDYNYSIDNCQLVFSFSQNLESRKIFYNNTRSSLFLPQRLNAGQSLNLPINYSFGSDFLEEKLNLTITNTNADYLSQGSAAEYFTATLLTSQTGPYLSQEASSDAPNGVVSIAPGTINLFAYLSNIMGNGSQVNTAYNVTSSWNIPNEFTNLTGSLDYLYENISSRYENSENLVLNYTSVSTIAPGMRYFILNSQGYQNISGNWSLITPSGSNATTLTNNISIYFSCNQVADGFIAMGCWPTDPDTVYCGNGHIDDNETCSTCSIDVGACVTQTTSPNVGPGGGPSNGPSNNRVEKSEANYELLRGGKQNFQLEIKNKYGDEMKNIKILVSGLNSEYISISPDSIDSLAPGATRNVTVTISAPGYFSGTKYTLIFDINANLVSNATSGALAAVTDKRFVTLYIVEVDRKDATVNLNESYSLIEEMNASGLILKEVNELLAEQNKAYLELNFLDVKTIYDQIKKIRDNAFESKQLIEEITADIAESEKNGITIVQSKKSLYLAQVAFNRGDYALALERLKEAKLVYALEVKGEYNLIYTIKNNPGKSFGIAIFVGLFGWGSSLVIRMRLYKNKLKNLTEEEILLLELMKMVQRQCFEDKKLSMEEYDQAMLQYEAKLSETIEDKIRTETKIANLLNIRGKRKALDQEKTRLIELIRKAQDDYLNKNKIETRIYEGMIKSYSTRLSEVDEQLAYAEAQDALKKQQNIKGMFKV